jgi:hypothetical protein
MIDCGEWQVRCHKSLAVFSEFAQKLDADTRRFLGIVLETVIPLRAIEPDLKDRVPDEGQPITAGRDADDAVTRGMAAGQLGDYARRDFIFLGEGADTVPVLLREL